MESTEQPPSVADDSYRVRQTSVGPCTIGGWKTSKIPPGEKRWDFFVVPLTYRFFLFRPTCEVAAEYPDSAIGSMIEGSCGS
jgi:hypothetical protein